MKKKNLALLLLSSSLLLSCGETDAPTDSSKDPASSSSLPSYALETIKGYIDATLYSGYTLQEKGAETVEGKVTLGTNGTLFEGKGAFAEEEVDDAFLYVGYDEKTNFYYEIENFRNRKAIKKSIVSASSNSNEITLAEAQRNIESISYNATYAEDALAPFFLATSQTTVTPKASKQSDQFAMDLDAYLGGTTTMKGTLVFDKANNTLSSFDVKKSVWPTDEWDEESKAPLDPSGKPSSSTEKKATLTKVKKGALSFDVAPYFITSIPNVYLSSFSDIKGNAGKAEVGKTIYMEFDSFLPKTALNESDIKVVATSDPSIVDFNVLGYPEAKKAGKCTLTVSDSFRSFNQGVQMEIASPSITALYLYADKKEMALNETMDLRIEFYDKASLDPIQAVSSNENVIAIEKVADDRLSLTVKALAYGTSDISIRTADGKIVSKAVTITVKEKESTPDEYEWLIGTWQGNDEEYETVLTFALDGKGTMKQNGGSERAMEWAYDSNTNKLTFTKWPSTLITANKIDVYYTKKKITIRWDDTIEDEYITEVFTKIA